ncbi:MAG: Pantothenate synthetase [Prosthecobacter sp.]|nr:Pantothenate synthetase [Prosthecobacter sp.]
MILLETVHELRAWRHQAGRVLLVPTMGALHEGHASLVREARRLAGDSARVAATIFVNPLQFGPNEDFDRYPRTLEADLRLCEEAGADLVFAPPVHEVYHPDRSISITESSLSTVLCGASRPGHFDGVCTVVAKLFNLVQPDEALFGRKDYQQLAVIRRLVRDLDIPVVIHGVETVREPDGLAMSSRNRYLTPEERAQAPALQAALRRARDAWLAGEQDVPRLLRAIREHVAVNAPLCREDYVSIVDPGSLQPLARVEHHAVALLAFWFGRARLIDNLELRR